MESGLGIPTREPLAGRDGIDAIAPAPKRSASPGSRSPTTRHLIVPCAIDSRHPRHAAVR